MLRPMVKGLPHKGVVLGLIVVGVFLSACSANQDEIEALQRQVSALKEEKRQVFVRLDDAVAERNQAESRLSRAQGNAEDLRGKVSELRQTVADLESQIGPSSYGSPDLYLEPDSDSYVDPGYGYDLDCSDFPDSNFPTPPGDPNGLDSDGDGIACES
jgi:hypothetical protein